MRTSISVHFFNLYIFYLYGFNKGFDGTGIIYVCRYYSMLLNCLRIVSFFLFWFICWGIIMIVWY